LATLTFVFDPYCPRSVVAAPAVLALWQEHRTRVRFEAVHAGTATARLGLGPDSERSARAFSALRAAAPHLEIPLVHEFHQVLRSERLGRRALTGIAQRVDVDPALVFEALRHPLRREHARKELERGNALRLSDGPAILYEHDHIFSSLPLEEPSLP